MQQQIEYQIHQEQHNNSKNYNRKIKRNKYGCIQKLENKLEQKAKKKGKRKKNNVDLTLNSQQQKTPPNAKRRTQSKFAYRACGPPSAASTLP